MNWTRIAVVATIALGIGASAFLALRPEDRPASVPGHDAPLPPDGGALPRATAPRAPPPPVPGTPSRTGTDAARRPDGAVPPAREQAELEVGRIRDQLLAGCERELRDARPPLSFRLRLVFDANGHEIIRSVSAEQKSPQAIANCLSRIAAGNLRIQPTGRTVTTVVPLTIP